MKLSRLPVALLMVVGLFGTAAHAANQGLFVNLTSNELDRAAMAIFIAQKALTEKGAEVTIFLNVDGVRLADKRLPSPTHPSGATLHEMLQTFMKAGGRVYACPMCMQNVGGMHEADLLEGIQAATMDGVWSALFAKDVRVLSY
jgi:predicted peroxiredoxin